MSDCSNNNPVCGILGTQYPIVLGAMRLITLAEMAAAVSNAGGFGLIAASGMEARELRKELEKTKALTKKPVGINIPVYRPNTLELIEVAIEMGVKTITTSAGNPAKVMDLARQGGVKVIHKVSSLKMAQKAQDAGVDAVIAMGFEAGGHVGREHVTTFCLVPQLVDNLDIPVLAAGGIVDARGVAAAFALGARGVEMGTRFVASNECPAPAFFQECLNKADCEATLLLGKEAMPIRVLKNAVTAMVSGMESGEADQAMVQSGDASYVMSGGDEHTAVMPCGQAAGLIDTVKSIDEIISEITEGIRQIARDVEKSFFC
ncbi:MAG: nitronate monooxygenase [Desulfatibacillum sp.]|nr:nitronate monooxygenase [Desulfatibacillum sp.]